MNTKQLNVYHCMRTDSRFTFTPQKQASVLVAAESQKRAAELFECTAREIAQYGGIVHNDRIQAFCRTEPEVVFVERRFGAYSRLSEIGDDTKIIHVDVKDPELYGVEYDHPGFGTISATRRTGEKNLFMVDYPQGHSISLRISTATLNRNNATDRIYERDSIVEIELSEVQWATLISSLNAGAVPCTLRAYRDPQTHDFMQPLMPDRHAADIETMTNEIEDRARKANESVSQARRRLKEIMAGPLRKGDLAEVLELLERSEREGVANLTFVTERAKETIFDAAQNAKAEVNAYIDHAIQRLGTKALGEKMLTQALERGVDARQIGQAVLDSMGEQDE